MEALAVRTAPVARRIAVVSTDSSVVPEVEQHLVPVFHTTILVSAKDALLFVAQGGVAAVVYDLEVGEQSTDEGLGQLQQMCSAHPELTVVAITSAQSRSVVRKGVQAGASAVFQAPVHFEELGEELAELLRANEEKQHAEALRIELESRYRFADLIGGSEAMRRVYEAIQRVATKNAPVMIRGESGTGKELVARAIVASSERRQRPFVAVNCAALPENLIESELFGNEKGAFTGAVAARAGHIELADGGTLFLDEIGSLGLNLQGKLLRVLQERQVTRLGGKTPKRIDFRLITATNEDLEAMTHAGRFREDLYYRIHVVPINLPPLRERKEDIPLLANHFLQIYCAANEVPLKKFEADVMEMLEEHAWPGNVRELENIIQRLVIMADSDVIRAQHLPKQLIAASTAQTQAMLIPEEGIDFDEEMQRIELAYLTAALHRAGGRKFAAARILGIPPQRMKYLCRKNGL